MKKDINKIVKRIISTHLDINEAKIKDDTNLEEDLGTDSLDMIELVMELETEFDCEILDEDMKKFKTVKNIVDFLKKV